jgi:hypothetical protein
MLIRPSTTELKDTKLWIYLNEIDSQLAECSIIFVQQITPILKSIQDIFLYYTRHDAHHGYRVLKRIEQIINKDCLIKDSNLSFSNVEVFLLICSSYAHDLGMAVFPNEEDQLLAQLGIAKDSHWKNDINLQKYLRKSHSERSGDYVDKNYETLKVPKNLVSPLDLLMKAHNLSINELEIQLGVRMAGGEKELNLKQLACILCIADSLEFSETRIVEGVLNTLKEKIKDYNDEEALISYKENMKHVCIGDSVAIGDDGKIIISGTFNDPEVLNLAYKTVDFIESWTRDYLDIDFKSPLKRLIIRGDSIEKNLIIKGSDFERIGIRMKKENIINLISSDSIWAGNGAIVIRELLQNSVEACRYRLFHSSKAENYFPEIIIICNKEERTICVSDNGCGMSRNVILNNFLTVGNSRSWDPSYGSSNFNSLARFGIGFWSSFTIANNAIIETAPFEQLFNKIDFNDKVEGLKFSISVSEFKDYTVFHNIKRSPGTSIKIYLKNNINIEDLLINLRSLVICSEIPIKITVDDDIYFIPTETILPSLQEITGPKFQVAIEKDVKEFTFNKTIGELDIKLKFLYRIENNATTFKLDQKSIILELFSPVFSHVKFAICGFATDSRTNDLIFDLSRVGVMISNTTNPAGYIFNLTRFSLMPSKEISKSKEILTDAIHEGYKQFLIATNSFNKKTIYNLNQESRANGGNVYGAYSQSKLFYFYSKISELLVFKLIRIENGFNIKNAPTRYELFDDLKNLDLELWSYTLGIYNKEVTLQPEQNSDYFYELVAAFNIPNNKTYYLEPNSEVDMLFDNDPNSFVQIMELKLPSMILKLPFIKIHTNSLALLEKNDSFLCDIRGVWSGFILEKEIFGANFIFLGQNKLIVKPNSFVSKEIKALYGKGQIIKLCEFVRLLEQALQGYVDESILKYM